MSSIRVRNICFTFNNPDEEITEFLHRAWESLPTTYLVIGDEVGESGTPHFQGYIELKNGVSFNRLKTAVGETIHFEARHGTAQQAADYCKKDGNFVEKGEISQQGCRTDLAEAIQSFHDGGFGQLAVTHPEAIVKYPTGFKALRYIEMSKQPRDNLEVWLFYGPPGCGKTRRAGADEPDVAKVDISGGWFDGYHGEGTLIIDDFCGSSSKTTLISLLQYLDRYRVDLPIKGSFVPLIARRIIVTSNIHPRDWYDYSKRRAHYAALMRRFTGVTIWKDVGTDPTDIRSTDECWKQFLDGPDVLSSDDVCYYDFIKHQ